MLIFKVVRNLVKKPTCCFSSLTIGDYKGFTWQSSWGKAALLTSDLGHSIEYTPGFEASYSQGLGPLWLVMSLCIFAFIFASWPRGLHSVGRGLLQAPLPRPTYGDWRGKTWRHFSPLWLSTQYLSYPSANLSLLFHPRVHKTDGDFSLGLPEYYWDDPCIYTDPCDPQQKSSSLGENKTGRNQHFLQFSPFAYTFIATYQRLHSYFYFGSL